MELQWYNMGCVGKDSCPDRELGRDCGRSPEAALARGWSHEAKQNYIQSLSGCHGMSWLGDGQAEGVCADTGTEVANLSFGDVLSVQTSCPSQMEQLFAHPLPLPLQSGRPRSWESLAWETRGWWQEWCSTKYLSVEQISPNPVQPEFIDLFLSEGCRGSLCGVEKGRKMPHQLPLGCAEAQKTGFHEGQDR